MVFLAGHGVTDTKNRYYYLTADSDAKAMICPGGAMPAGVGSLAMVEGAGHYPHLQYPDETVALLLPFLARTAARA